MVILLKFCFVPVCLELWSLALEAWLRLVVNGVGELLTEKNSCGIARFPLATARLSCLNSALHQAHPVSLFFRTAKPFPVISILKRIKLSNVVSHTLCCFC